MPKGKRGFTAESARKAVEKRWKKVRETGQIKRAVSVLEFNIPSVSNWQTVPIAEGMALLASMRDSWEQGAKILNQRQSTVEQKIFCLVCENELPKQYDHTRKSYTYTFASQMTRKDPKTDLYYNEYICSQNCYNNAVRRELFSRDRVPKAATT